MDRPLHEGHRSRPGRATWSPTRRPARTAPTVVARSRPTTGPRSPRAKSSSRTRPARRSEATAGTVPLPQRSIRSAQAMPARPNRTQVEPGSASYDTDSGPGRRLHRDGLADRDREDLGRQRTGLADRSQAGRSRRCRQQDAGRPWNLAPGRLRLPGLPAPSRSLEGRRGPQPEAGAARTRLGRNRPRASSATTPGPRTTSRK